MWTPVDITAVPTAKELVDAKIAIEHVKTELEEALLSLEQAKLRVANLKKDLKARRAWIAPIRRFSFDALSHIFEFCGEDSWKTPLRISGVSRQWRNLVLATFRAWVFLNVNECYGRDDLIKHFFQHSGQRPLHVSLSPSQDLTILSEVIGRLECLSIAGCSLFEEILAFPKLERFSVRGIDEFIGLLDLRVARFPALRELICEASIIRGTMSSPNSMEVTFPPLQVLPIEMVDGTAWMDLLSGCQRSLVSLKLYLVDQYPASSQQVILSSLKCLQVHVWQEYPVTWPMDLKTPAVETYIESPKRAIPPTGTTPIHGNIGSVTQMCISYVPNLSSMSVLHTLRLEFGVSIADVLSQLQLNRTLCPMLELIEVLRAGDLTPYEMSLFEVKRERSHPISIRNVETWATALPYEIVLSPVSGRFRNDIPTKVILSVGQTCLAADITFRYRDHQLTVYYRSASNALFKRN